ncbi:putative phage protein (DUF1320 domain) [Campylobacter blaseri]|uniref:DUF1320 domain-containing protein n=1 Tax=Campylobacter blaseri TaxID=2042961 RepID=A0A2P8QYN8_9BACT|nr:phage protein Gp36 family protein [Campylobacter blaseri]PSM51350.1 hypothetical protein CQ405_08145 [Campylobacter blaseri]PSM52800.1 hypothetical protein CRN67_08150 [Campylobacter blaseri]QKF86100.1 putative phage protein (DUF1320 domain) [Campylobacter blaseri]
MIDNDELLKELSKKELEELSDLNGNFKINQDVINDAIKDATSFIASFIVIPKNPTPLLKQICTLLTIIELKRKQNYPKENYKDELEKCESLLIKMANGKIPIELKNESKLIVKQRAFKHNDYIMKDWSSVNG